MITQFRVQSTNLVQQNDHKFCSDQEPDGHAAASGTDYATLLVSVENSPPLVVQQNMEPHQHEVISIIHDAHVRV